MINRRIRILHDVQRDEDSKFVAISNNCFDLDVPPCGGRPDRRGFCRLFLEPQQSQSHRGGVMQNPPGHPVVRQRQRYSDELFQLQQK